MDWVCAVALLFCSGGFLMGGAMAAAEGFHEERPVWHVVLNLVCLVGLAVAVIWLMNLSWDLVCH